MSKAKPILYAQTPSAKARPVGRPRSNDKKMRRNFCLSREAMGRLWGITNASSYLDKMIIHRAQRAHKSLLILRGAGWTNKEILAACEVCSFEWRDTANLSAYMVSLETIDTENINGNNLSDRILNSNCEALALHEVVTEYHCGNTVIQESLRE